MLSSGRTGIVHRLQCRKFGYATFTGLMSHEMCKMQHAFAQVFLSKEQETKESVEGTSFWTNFDNVQLLAS